MNILYLDTLFFVNFLCDYFTLLCSAKVSGAIIRRGPIAIAAVIGGLYACLVCLPVPGWVSHPIVKLCFGISLCAIAFRKERTFMQCCLIFFCISAALGGILSALSLSVNGIMYLPIRGKTVIITFAAVYFLLSVFLRRSPETSRKQVHQINVQFGQQSITFTALRDTGNTLYDPITNLPVVVCGSDLLPLFFPELPDIQYNYDPYDLFFRLSDYKHYTGRLKLIPYQTINGHGVLLAVRPDSLLVDEKLTEAAVAFSPAHFSTQHTYQAIL